jgi:hypothetical protein
MSARSGGKKRTKRQLSRSRQLVVEIIGWLGAAILVVAYLMVSFDVVSGDSVLYQVLNIMAASGLIVNGLAHRAMPSVVTNAVWMLIGIAVIVNILL